MEPCCEEAQLLARLRWVATSGVLVFARVCARAGCVPVPIVLKAIVRYCKDADAIASVPEPWRDVPSLSANALLSMKQRSASWLSCRRDHWHTGYSKFSVQSKGERPTQRTAPQPHHPPCFDHHCSLRSIPSRHLPALEIVAVEAR